MDPISYPGPYCEARAINEVDALLETDEFPVLSQVDLTRGYV